MIPAADILDTARQWLAAAPAVLIGAGAGMGVDSGLPDFRGNEGFWRAYPALRGQSFADLASPAQFRDNPRRAWGFYGHRLQLYRRTRPHAGFRLLLRWLEQRNRPWFVFTSNVDGHFQRAGFPQENIVEIHGSIHRLQCLDGCGEPPWPADGFEPEIDVCQVLARGPLPRCPGCGGLARPNILMFGDGGWESEPSDRQYQRYHTWLRRNPNRTGLELGAGTAIPSVRVEVEDRCRRFIRINPRDTDTPPHGLGLGMGACKGLERLLG